MLIVEGPDNAGKTQLITKFLELDPSLRVLTRDKFNPKKGENIGTSYLKALEPPDSDRIRHGNSVADRFFASECIYGKLFRGKCRMTPAQHMAVRSMLAAYGAIVVHCDPGDEAIIASWRERGQLYDNPLAIAQAYRKDLKSIFGPSVPVYSYDYTTDDTTTIQRIVSRHRAMRITNAPYLSWWSALPYGSGRLHRPGVVLIGESPSPRANTGVPFAHGPAGDFLAWTLAQASTRLKTDLVATTYFTNALKGTERDGAILREELRALDLPIHASIIALGREAQRVLDDVRPLDRHCAHLEHPSWWLRFQGRSKLTYVDKFISALAPESYPQRHLEIA